MIRIYDSRETVFTHNGLGILKDTIKCEVTEEVNGAYELELEYPVDPLGKWQLIQEDNIVKAHTPKYGDQLFRIVKKVKVNNRISAYARHIFYDLLDNMLEDCRPTGLNGYNALNWILNGTQFPHNFTAVSDIANNSSATYIRKNPVNALIGDAENSYLSRWGGEIERDNFTIRMVASAGQNRGVSIAYGKNLKGFEETKDSSSVVTRLLLTGLNENDTVVYLPEKYIDSEYINSYPHPKIQHIHYTDFKVNSEEGIALEDVYTMLRAEAQRLFEIEKIDIPQLNYKVEFEELTKTEQYKDYAVLERVYLYDTVTIRHKKLNTNISAQVIKYKYNSLTKKYINLELGNFKDNINKSFSSIEKKLIEVAEIIKANKDDLGLAIEHVTGLLTSALGGHVYKRAGELLIMDTDNPNTATRVWRWNLNGLGYSSTGINGPYETAITMDGTIAGKFIVALTVTAAQVKTGILRSTNGYTYINLDTGEFKFESGIINFSEEGMRVSHSNTNIDTVQSSDGFYIVERGKSIEEAKASFNDKGIDTSNIAAESANFNDVYVNKTVKLYQDNSVNYYVNTATGSDDNPGTSAAPFRSFNKAISLIGGYIPAGVLVTINCSGTFQEPIYIANYFGGGIITVSFNENCIMRKGAFICGNTARINLYGTKTWDQAGGTLWDGTYDGSTTVLISRSYSVFIENFRFANSHTGVRVFENSFCNIFNLDFGSSVEHAIWANKSTISNAGYRGSSAYSLIMHQASIVSHSNAGATSSISEGEIQIYYGSQQWGSYTQQASAFAAPPAPPVSTYETTWGMTSGKTKCTNSGDRTDGLLQGYYDSSRGQQRALIYFDIANIRNTLSGATINDVQVYAQRINTAHGTYAGQPVHIWSKSGETAVTKYGNFGSLTQGAGTWLGAGSLVGLGNALRDGSADGVMFYDQNAWSQNASYIRFEWNVKLWIRYTK